MTYPKIFERSERCAKTLVRLGCSAAESILPCPTFPLPPTNHLHDNVYNHIDNHAAATTTISSATATTSLSPTANPLSRVFRVVYRIATLWLQMSR